MYGRNNGIGSAAIQSLRYVNQLVRALVRQPFARPEGALPQRADSRAPVPAVR
jgi:hypothetical protein